MPDAAQIRVEYELNCQCPQPTPMILGLNVPFTRVSDLVAPDHICTDPSVQITPDRDGYGNWRSRIVAPPGEIRISTDAVINDSGLPGEIAGGAAQHPEEELPAEAFVASLGSRSCKTDSLSEAAWDLFGHTALGWPRVQAICDFVHRHITFGYQHSRATRTSYDRKLGNERLRKAAYSSIRDQSNAAPVATKEEHATDNERNRDPRSRR